MLQGEHSAIFLAFIKQQFVIRIFNLSIFERSFYTGLTVVRIVLSYFAIILLRRREMWLLYLIVFLLSCGCISSVALPLGAVGWSVACNCGILVILTWF